MEALLVAMLSQDASPSVHLGVHEKYFGLEAAVVECEERRGGQLQITAGLEISRVRAQIAMGRVWWDGPRGHKHGSDVNYALSARAEYRGFVLEYRHYSTGKGILGEQIYKYNPGYDGAHFGYAWKF